jgi:hypothetical protein
VLHVELNSAEPTAWNQDGLHSGNDDVHLLQSFWFLKSDTLGKVSVGKLSTGSDNAAILVDGSGSAISANWVLFDGAGFFLRSDDNAGGGNPGGYLGGYTWGDFASCRTGGIAGDCNGVPMNAVRYDTPTWNGFSASAGWGEDDFWDGAVRYAGEFQGFKVAATGAYTQQTDASLTSGNNEAHDTKYWQVAAYVQHVTSGVFAYGAYGQLEADGLSNFDNGGPNLVIPDASTWYAKAGVRRNWLGLGHTVLYGEFMRVTDQTSDAALDVADDPGWDTASAEIEMWGLGIVQEIDSAATSIWIKYRRIDGSRDAVCNGQGGCGPAGSTDSLDFEPIQFIGVGALVNF